MRPDSETDSGTLPLSFRLTSTMRAALMTIRALAAQDDPLDEAMEHEGEDKEDVPETGISYPVPQPLPPTSWLVPGQVFEGFQRYSTSSSPRGLSLEDSLDQDDWHVLLKVHAVDWASGTAQGVMHATDVPLRCNGEIITYWDAEVIDNKHHTFFSPAGWGASRALDLEHWSKFASFPAWMRLAVATHGGRCCELHRHSHVFIRLKERTFVNVGPEDCGLTIGGLYYLQLDRATGVISGFYADPSPISTPHQYLEVVPQAPRGMAFGSYAFA